MLIRKVRRLNESLYIGIPKNIAQMIGIEEGSELEVTYDGRRSIILRTPDKRCPPKRFEVIKCQSG